MPLSKRKHPRLKSYDYGAKGIYFITVCTKNRIPCLCNINAVGRDDPIPPLRDDPIPPLRDDPITAPLDDELLSVSTSHIQPTENVQIAVTLTDIGKVVDKYINSIEQSYNNVFVKKYVIMPDHVHLLIYIDDMDDVMETTSGVMGLSGVMGSSRPTIPIIIKGLKRMVTKEIGYSIWQDSFYDEIVRNENAYRNVWKYIDINPSRWLNNSKD